MNAEFAFVEGMTGAAAISAMAAMINAVLVKLYMPIRIFGEEAPDGR